MNRENFLKVRGSWTLAFMIAATTFTGVSLWYSLGKLGGTRPTSQAQTPPPTVNRVTALGRLEPQTEVIRLGAPATLQDDKVAQLLVKQGDRIQLGQIVAILESRDRLQAALKQAEEQVKIAQARLAQVQAGAKTGEIAAQQATIRRIEAEWQTDKTVQFTIIAKLEAQWQGEIKAQTATLSKLDAELQNAQAEYQRYQQLHKDGAISNSLLDSKRLALETSQAQLNEAKANLKRIQTTGTEQLQEARANLDRINRTAHEQLQEAQATLKKIAEVRPVDVQAAQAEVNSAIATVKRAEADLSLAEVRSPIAGQVLKIHTHAGEKIDEQGIVELGQTDQMMVVAEVYQTDIQKVKLGQIATIKSPAFAGELGGKVIETGLQVSRQNIFSTEPGENLDRRVIEVKIQLTPEASQRVAQLTNLQVEVYIDTQ